MQPDLTVAEIIDALCVEIDHTTQSKDFIVFEEEEQTIVKLALIGTEVSEAIAEHRESNPDWDAFTSELADIVIRTFDLAGFLRLPLGEALVAKMDKNKDRPARHGKRY